MAKTSNPMLLLVTLAGLSVGLWLAARTVGRAGNPAPVGPQDASKGGDPDERAVGVVLDESGPVVPARRRGPDPRDVVLIPKPGETCLSAAIESTGGARLRKAGVALFAIEDGHPRFPPLTTFAVGDDGIVRSCAKIEQDIEMVAFAAGFRPASQRLRATDLPSMNTGRIDLGTFALEPGETVQGRVTAAGVPLARAEVEARATAPGYEARVEGGSLGWRAGHYVWSAQRVETGTDGSYSIGGLEPGDHVMRLCTVRQRDVAIDVQKIATKRANAPAETVDFAVPAARLDLSFQSSGSPLCCVEVQIEAGERQFTRRTDEAGRIGFLIQPELAYQLTAARFGFSTFRAQLRGLVDGERRPETLALEPQSELATLVIDDNNSSMMPMATFELRPRFPTSEQVVDVRRDIARDPDTRKFVLQHVPAGSWRVTMRSGHWIGGGSTLARNCDRDIVVQVPDSGTAYAQISITERGGLVLSTHTEDGSPLTPTASLFDTKGGAIDGVVVLLHAPLGMYDDDDHRVLSAAINDDRPAIPGQRAVFSSWCAGVADLVVSAPGMDSVTTRVSITAGELKPVNVVLHPR